MGHQNRKSTTILAMDVAGYSAKMNENEAGVVAQLKNSQKIIEEIAAKKGGRIFNTAGDSFMIEFSTTVGAVEAAVDIQKRISIHNANVSISEQLEFRIGINMGDVTVDGDNILGDGVNIAARLESIAPPLGICVSEVVQTTVKGKIKYNFIDKGPQKLKNISEPIRAYLIDVQFGTIDPKKFKTSNETINKTVYFLASAVAAVLLIWVLLFQLSNRNDVSRKITTVAVLPVLSLNESGPHSLQKSFAAGLAQDLGNGLRSMARGLNIINLSEAPDNLIETASKLDVSYFLTGNIRESGKELRFSVSLIDAATTNTIWIQNIDTILEAKNVFQVQDKIVKDVVQELVGNGAILEKDVFKKVMSIGPDSLNAYECINFTRIKTFISLDPRDYVKSRKCLQSTVRSDPSYALAWTYLALINHDEYAFGYNNPSRDFLFDGLEQIAKAIQLDPYSGLAYAYKAHLHFQLKDWDSTFRDAEKAIELEPNNYLVLGPASQMILFAGTCTHETHMERERPDRYVSGNCRWQKGYKYSLKTADLDKGNTDIFENYSLAQVYNLWGEYQLALDQLMMARAPDFYYWNVATGMALHGLGREEEAQKRFGRAAEILGGADLNLIYELLEIYNSVQREWPMWEPVLSEYGWK